MINNKGPLPNDVDQQITDGNSPPHSLLKRFAPNDLNSRIIHQLIAEDEVPFDFSWMHFFGIVWNLPDLAVLKWSRFSSERSTSAMSSKASFETRSKPERGLHWRLSNQWKPFQRDLIQRAAFQAAFIVYVSSCSIGMRWAHGQIVL